jgi:tetratricopeptide (TPR) repeat protein
MGAKASLIGLAGAGLLAAACATQGHQTARADEATFLAKASQVHPMALQETGTEADAYGDKWTAANLYERSVDKDNSVVARFNLANAYAETGRLPEAAAIYQILVRDGQFMWGVSGVDYRNRGARLVRFNIADESAARLATIRRQTTFASNTSGGALSASELSTPTAAIVGGPAPIIEHRISDAEALQRDSAGR